MTQSGVTVSLLETVFAVTSSVCQTIAAELDKNRLSGCAAKSPTHIIFIDFRRASY